MRAPRHYRDRNGFALVITLVIMALILVTVVGYLMLSRGGRTASDLYASRLRAEMMADTALAAAGSLLEEHTRYGNYITASSTNVAAASGSAWLPELYRPDPAWDAGAGRANYLSVLNAVGIPLISLAQTNAGTNQLDPRPAPQAIAATNTFRLASLGLSDSDAYNFNQSVRLGTNWGRLVEPSPHPVYGQWVRVRDASGALVGRYAFVAVDESMRVNLNAVGNTNGPAGAHLRYNDLTNAAAPTPDRISEIDPAPVVSTSTNNFAAITANLTALGAAGDRLPTVGTAGLLTNWGQFHEYAAMVTTMSESDNTTARGWTRMNLNQVVAQAEIAAAAGNTTAKRAAAERISNWIRDAWTGPPLASLQQHQLYNDPRLRMQVAANIVDYIDADNVPTDCGTFPSGLEDVPVLGIERIPYLTEIDVLYEATEVDAINRTATLTVRFGFKFSNLYGEDLSLQDSVGSIDVKGVPVILDDDGSVILDVEADTFTVSINGMAPTIGGAVPKGVAGNGTSGAVTFFTGPVVVRSVTFASTADNARPRIESGSLEVTLRDASGNRVDVGKVAINDRRTGRRQPASSGQESAGHFIVDNGTSGNATNNVTTTLNATAAICTPYSVFPPSNPIELGDPRYRPGLLTGRWYHTTRSDPERIDSLKSSWEQSSRTYAVDWYDRVGNHPLAFLRNGPMQSVGELSLVAACEYPWRTLYLQQPDRPANTAQVGPATDIPVRRLGAQDAVVMDLFTTATNRVVAGAINPNGDLHVRTAGGTIERGPWVALHRGLRAGNETLAIGGSRALADLMAARRAAVATNENQPPRPFLTRGDVAAAMGRAVSLSNGTSVSSRSLVQSSVFTNTNSFKSDYQVEQPFRGISEQIATRGNVFRVLYVGQSVRDLDGDGLVATNEVQGEFLGESYIRREPRRATDPSNADLEQTTNSIYRVLSKRPIFE
jgi:hypothetical protein